METKFYIKNKKTGNYDHFFSRDVNILPRENEYIRFYDPHNKRIDTFKVLNVMHCYGIGNHNSAEITMEHIKTENYIF